MHIAISMRVDGGGALTTPISIFGGSSVLCWLRGDLGITIATGVSAWADQSGNGNDFIQNTAGNHPSYNASGLNGRGTLGFTRASNHRLDCAGFTLPAPGTTPTTFLWVFRQDAFVASSNVFGGLAANNLRVRQVTASPILEMNSGTAANANGGAAIASWVLGIASFTNSTADYLKLGSTAAVTGASAGNGSTVGRQLGSSASAGPISMTFAEKVVLNRVPSAEELTAFAAYVTGIWGATVAV